MQVLISDLRRLNEWKEPTMKMGSCCMGIMTFVLRIKDYFAEFVIKIK